MQKLQLYIGGQRVDLFKDETVTLNQTIQNIKDPAKIFVEFTKDFTIPASKTNNLIFKHYYNYDISTNLYDARFKTAAEIQLNNITFKEGFVKLEGVDLQLNSPYAYRIVFYGNTVSLKDSLGEAKLQELNLTTYDLDYNMTTIKARLENISNHIVAPLITSGASNEDDPLNPSRLFYNSATSAHTNGTGNLFYHTGSNHDHGVLYSDLKYGIRIHQIILAIQANANYGITFTDDFFNTTNTSYYNLFMWLHRKKGSVEPVGQTDSFPTPVTDFDLPLQRTTMLNGTTLEVYSSCNPYASASCPNTSLPTITQSIRFTTTSSNPYDVIIYRNGVVWSTHSNLQGTNTLTKADMPLMDEAAYTVTIFVGTGVTITFTEVKWFLAGIFNGTPWTEDYATTTSFNATATFRFIISQQIPEMKILDFLTSLFQMFNLTAYVVEDPADADVGKIRVQALDDFYSDFNIYDISEYVDVKNKTVDAALPYRQISFGYEGTETFLAKQYDQLTGKLWGAANFTGDNTTTGDSFDGNNQTYSIKIPFEHVLFERLVDANPTLTSITGKTSAQYGYFVDDNQDAYYGKPLLFYPVLINSSSANYKQISFRESTSSHTPISQYYIPSNSVSTSAATSTSNINFYQETNEYSPSESFSGTLFNNYYREYIRSIFDINRRLISIKAFLPLKILYKLKLSDILLINNRTFNINTIQTNLQTGESDIELLNDFSQTFLLLTDVFFQNVGRDVFYKSNVGNAENLKNGDIIYADSNLTIPLGAGTYTQTGTGETTTHCPNNGTVMAMTLNSSGAITSISCGLP